MEQENERVEFYSYNHVDVNIAKVHLMILCRIDQELIESLPIGFDENGQLLKYPLKDFLLMSEIVTLSECFVIHPAGDWVYDILEDMGYPKSMFPGWRPTFYKNGRLNHAGLVGVLGWKNIDILHQKLRDIGAEPTETPSISIDNPKREREYFSDRPILDDLNKNMRALIEAEGYSEEAPPQSTFVIEEASELVVELMKLVKILCKEQRKKVTREDVFGEACDVMATIMMFFVKNGYPTHDVFTYISGKYRRAAERFADKKEL